MRIPIIVMSVALAFIAANCTLGTLVRADDSAEFSMMRVNAVCLTLLWPLAFALLGLAMRMKWGRIVVWTILVLFVGWVFGAGRIQGQCSRGGGCQTVLGL